MAIVGLTNSSGGSIFALIIVNYPSGSTVTCSNSSGKRDISSTQRMYYIKRDTVPFNCVVTATDGTNTKSKTVSITSEGQSNTITLNYSLVLYEAGVTSGFEGIAWQSAYGQATSAPVIEYNNNDLCIYHRSSTAGGTTGVAMYSNAVDISDYSSIKVRMTSETALPQHNASAEIMGIWSTKNAASDYYYSAAVSSVEITSAGAATYVLDVSSLTGEYYIGVGIRRGTGNCYHIAEWWLE